MKKEITQKVNDCEVTITFVKKTEPVKDKVLWLILESFKERIKIQLAETVEPK